jgi:hypothetical protein
VLPFASPVAVGAPLLSLVPDDDVLPGLAELSRGGGDVSRGTATDDGLSRVMVVAEPLSRLLPAAAPRVEVDGPPAGTDVALPPAGGATRAVCAGARTTSAGAEGSGARAVPSAPR